MKPLIRYSLYALALIIVPLALAAAKVKTSKPVYRLPEYKVEDLTFPIPLKVVVPRVGRSLVGHEVSMVFDVAANGRTSNITQASISPEQATNDLAAAMKMVLRKWEFEPAQNEYGIFIAVKVSLPVQVVRSGGNA